MRYALNTVPINGNETIYMVGLASMMLNASGLTNKQRPFAASTVVMVINAGAALVHGTALIGDAPIVLDAGATIKHTLPMLSDPAAMVLGAKFGIPRPKTIPAQFNDSHLSRIGRIRRERREAEVAIEDRQGNVPIELRTGRVAPERTT